MDIQCLTGWPENVLPKLFKKMDLIANNKEVDEFYIGRSVDIGKRQSEHSCDEIIPIYSTDSIDNAIEVEKILIRKFINRKKCNNKAEDGRGNFSDDGSYVYVAIWYLRN